MGQFTLGLRSLLIKAAVFVTMAALLAWALGGTLWPRPHVAELRSLGVTIGDTQYFWTIVIDERNQDHSQWRLMVKPSSRLGVETHAIDERAWNEGAGPIAVNGTLYFAGRDAGNRWRIIGVNATERGLDVPMPDRLAVEQQLARLAAGLPLQDIQAINQQRRAVLDPQSKLADEVKSP